MASWVPRTRTLPAVLVWLSLTMLLAQCFSQTKITPLPAADANAGRDVGTGNISETGDIRPSDDRFTFEVANPVDTNGTGGVGAGRGGAADGSMAGSGGSGGSDGPTGAGGTTGVDAIRPDHALDFGARPDVVVEVAVDLLPDLQPPPGSEAGPEVTPDSVPDIPSICTPNDTACKVTQLAAGGNHTCALLSDRMVRCWGDNGSGQLGNGSTTFSAKPVLVGGLGNVALVAAGPSNSCAVSSGGTISCWGDNSAGQLGISPSAQSYSSTPVTISSTTTTAASTVTIGAAHVCYLVRADNTVRCWGQSSYGRLGNGTTSSGVVTTPTSISGLSGVASLSAGSTHTCVSLSDLSVRCWGQDNWGQVGDGGSITPSATPVTVLDHGYAISAIRSVTSGLGGNHACALRNDGEGECWGRDSFGQVGAGAVADIAPAVPVMAADGSANFGGMVSMSSGANHTCAVLTDGTGVCWGLNSQGQLGNSSTADSYTPIPVSGLRSITAVSAGGSHTCALVANGSVQCWGFNSTGQVGDNTTTQRSAPVAVKNLLPP